MSVGEYLKMIIERHTTNNETKLNALILLIELLQKHLDPLKIYILCTEVIKLYDNLATNKDQVAINEKDLQAQLLALTSVLDNKLGQLDRDSIAKFKSYIDEAIGGGSTKGANHQAKQNFLKFVDDTIKRQAAMQESRTIEAYNVPKVEAAAMQESGIIEVYNVPQVEAALRRYQPSGFKLSTCEINKIEKIIDGSYKITGLGYKKQDKKQERSIIIDPNGLVTGLDGPTLDRMEKEMKNNLQGLFGYFQVDAPKEFMTNFKQRNNPPFILAPAANYDRVTEIQPLEDGFYKIIGSNIRDQPRCIIISPDGNITGFSGPDLGQVEEKMKNNLNAIFEHFNKELPICMIKFNIQNIENKIRALASSSGVFSEETKKANIERLQVELQRYRLLEQPKTGNVQAEPSKRPTSSRRKRRGS